MINIILIAPPAAGKGTMSKMLHEKYGLVHISVGQLLRDIDPLSSIGKQIKEKLANRELVPNELVKSSLIKRLKMDDVKNNGFILDGFPRSLEQVRVFNEICEELNITCYLAVYLKSSYDVSLKRTLGRYSCSKCKTDYNILTGYNNPINDKNCRICNADLVRRTDDNEEVLKKGYKKFEDETLPVVDYYRKNNNIIEVDSNGDARLVFEELERKLEFYD